MKIFFILILSSIFYIVWINNFNLNRISKIVNNSISVDFFNYNYKSILESFFSIKKEPKWKNITEICNYTINDFNRTNFSTLIDKQVLSFDQIEENIKNLSIKLVKGGRSYTELNSGCKLNSTGKRIAFIIPYRNRLNNLKVWLNNMHRILTNQKITYGIYLIEPVENITFNRALLMNIGFIQSIRDTLKSKELKKKINTNLRLLKIANSYWDCFVFHDVDMIPEGF